MNEQLKQTLLKLMLEVMDKEIMSEDIIDLKGK